MQKLSEIISKQVLNIYLGKTEGIIFDAIFDKNLNKITYFKIFDEQEEEYLLDTKKIYNIGEDICVIKNSEALNLITTTEKENNPTGKTIYSTTGKNLGRLIDIEFTPDYHVSKLITTQTTIFPTKIINIADNIIVNLEDKKINLNMLKPKIKILTNTSNVVSIMPKIISTKTLETQNQQKESFKTSPSILPTKLSSNVEFLIGRKVLKTIYGINNEILIKKDAIITSKNIELAKKHSKITELALFTKQKA